MCKVNRNAIKLHSVNCEVLTFAIPSSLAGICYSKHGRCNERCRNIRKSETWGAVILFHCYCFFSSFLLANICTEWLVKHWVPKNVVKWHGTSEMTIWDVSIGPIYVNARGTICQVFVKYFRNQFATSSIILWICLTWVVNKEQKDRHERVSSRTFWI